ncbi:MAG: SIS domain-containing protein [Eubacterium sp.]|nr:SIS domain-containing protein [Eubacterium sp.]
MSGIFAYIGRDEPSKLLLDGLAMLQHRGGEVNGVAVKVKDGFSTARAEGGIEELRKAAKKVADGSCGLAQTSRQTRCRSEISAAPSSNNMYAAVCDDSIQNFNFLRRWSKEPFSINTDEDLLLACLCITNSRDRIELTQKIKAALLGSPGFAFIASDECAVYACAGSSQLFVGTGEEGLFLSSELAPLFSTCDKYAVLKKSELVKLKTEKAQFFDEKGKKAKKSFIPMPDRVYYENDYSLSDEIYCCSVAAKEVYQRFAKNSKLNFDSVKLSKRSVERLSRIILVGEGSSYNSALYCRHMLEMMTDIPSFAYPAGEFRYAKGVIDKNTLVIAVSHRGDAPDTLACVSRAESVGAKTLAVTGSDTSSLALLSDKLLFTGCDLSYGVSLRTFIGESLCLALLSLYIGVKDDVVTDLYLNVAIKMAEIISGKIASAVKDNTAYVNAVNLISAADTVYACGIGADFSAAREAADKMRRITGKSCFALTLGELALYGENSLCGTTVLAFATNRDRAPACDVMLSRIKTLGARVVLFTTESIEEDITAFDTVISVNDTLPIYNPLPCVAASYKLSMMLESAKEKSGEAEPAAS